MTRKPALLLILFTFLLSACGPGQLFGPTITPTATSTPIPTATSIPTVTFTPTLRPTPIVYDGDWVGTTSAGGRITFSLDSEGIHSIRVSFGLSTKNSTCNVDMNSTITPSWPLSVNTFNFHTTDLTIKGVFDSATTASGTVVARQDSKNCTGGVDLTWTAEKQ